MKNLPLSPWLFLAAMTATFLYRCPTTGYRVQGFIADNPADKNGHVYEAMTCIVCKRIHLVDPKTGKVAAADGK